MRSAPTFQNARLEPRVNSNLDHNNALRDLAPNLLFGGQESRSSCAEQANLAELRKDYSHVKIQQTEGADDNKGSIEKEAYDAIAGCLWLIILVSGSCHSCVHSSCRTQV